MTTSGMIVRMAIDTIESGWLTQARHLPSPNCDARPDGVVPSLIIVHGISLPPDEFGGPYIDQLFTNQLDWNAHPYFKQIEGMRVSSHVLIRRDGEVVQYVPFEHRAWHAGVSSYQGRERCNDFAIGIELEGADHLAYESAQYRELARVIAVLCRTYSSLSRERIAGHSEVAPGRKTDPGEAFDWPRLHAMLSALLCLRA